MIDWIKVKNHYLKTTDSLETTADHFKIDQSGVKGRASREKWQEAKKEFQRKVDRMATEKSIELKAEDLAQKNTRRAKMWKDLENLVYSKIEVVKTRIQTGTISAVSDKDLKGLEQVANIMKTATQGERLEDGQPTSIQKGEMEHTDKTLEDILKGNGIIGAKLKESQRERSGEVIDRKADKDSGQAKKDSPVDPKPSPVKVPPGNDKPELDPKAPAKGV